MPSQQTLQFFSARYFFYKLCIGSWFSGFLVSNVWVRVISYLPRRNKNVLNLTKKRGRSKYSKRRNNLLYTFTDKKRKLYNKYINLVFGYSTKVLLHSVDYIEKLHEQAEAQNSSNKKE